MWYKNLGTSFFSFVTTHAFDRGTDRETDRPTDRQAWQYRALHYMQSQGKMRQLSNFTYILIVSRKG